MTPTSVAGISVAELTVADPPEAWRAAGFAVDASGVATVGTVRIRCTGGDEAGAGGADLDVAGGAGGRSGAGAAGLAGAEMVADVGGAGRGPTGLTGWVLRGGGGGDVDGLPTRWTTDAPPDPVPPSAHPNGAVVVDHVVVMTSDGARTTAAFEARGLAARRVRDAGTADSPLQQTFFRAGEVIIELVAPLPQAEVATAASAPPSPAHAAVAARFWGLAFTVADLDAAASLLGGHCGAPHDAVQPGRRIATLRHRRLGISLPVALMSARE